MSKLGIAPIVVGFVLLLIAIIGQLSWQPSSGAFVQAFLTLVQSAVLGGFGLVLIIVGIIILVKY